MHACVCVCPTVVMALVLLRFLVLTRQSVLGNQAPEPVNAAPSFAGPLAAWLLVWLSAAFR